ncbi:PREDICTED: CLAVATA3/ESR (CLE)-related protein 43-like [Camelina sativa]|uniref:CLAVATA3/ESR (CLE)-related protein 43-like n=1 Tax=Camelina sativa TaxID=90675 RepID=A0ABM0WYD2_CAMSA|nr:PREDICTED: CLAVATA3/ESR (CLE)-related protein 43-like [Camelina sativa]
MGCRDILLTFSVALLLISLFQIWLFREGRQVPELSEDQLGKDRKALLASKNNKDDDDVHQRLYQRYFKGRSFGVNNTNSSFEDSNRRIPSSPDRLHN